MSFPRRGRPTLRVLREDLGMTIGERGLDPHSPLSAIDHPIIRKAAESFEVDVAADLHEGPIQSSRRHRLLEIRMSQWRGGVWVDEATGQPWLVAAGLAKGGHRDHDDFYERVKRADESANTDVWLPTDVDQRQLRREAAAALMVQWDLVLQRMTLVSLESVLGGGSITFVVPHPKSDEPELGNATLTVEIVNKLGHYDEDLLVEIDLAGQHKASNLGWAAILRILKTLNPRQDAWDMGGGIYSPLPHSGRLADRAAELRGLVAADELVLSIPNDRAHFSHRRNLAEATIVGKGVRSMCGIYFVPTRDHEALPKCEICAERYARLP